MKIDFTKVQIKDIEGKAVTADVSKDLGNMMYFGDKDIAVADLGHEIYHKGEVDLNREQAQIVKAYVEEGFVAIVRRDLIPLLDSVK